jgi:hypothetical protein
MSVSAMQRSTMVRLKTGESFSIAERSTSIRRHDKKDEALAERYGGFPPDLFEGQDAVAISAAHHRLSQRMLLTDGHREMSVVLLRGSRPVDLNVLGMNQPGKYALWQHVADRAEAVDADGIITMGEIWIAPFDPARPDAPAEENPQRREALQTVALMADGRGVQLITEFHREGDKIVLGATTETSKLTAPFLDAIRALWARKDPKTNPVPASSDTPSKA